MPSERRYIVTGGAGFVGSNLVAELMRREPNCRLVVVDSFRSGSYANIVEACQRAGVGSFTGSVEARSAASIDWPSVIEHVGAAAVFHLGAITDTTVSNEPEMIHENVGGFRADDPKSMLVGCARAGVPLVYASSAATYGTPPETAQRKAFPLTAAGVPNNVYGFSKWLMECEHRRFAASNANAHIVGLRYFNVFGPGESRKGKMASMVFQLANQLLTGKAPRLFADGSQARDQVYVADVVDCTLHASGLFGSHRIVSGVYNLGSGQITSFNQIVLALREALGIPKGRLETEFFEMPPAIRAFYQDFTLADMSATEAGLSWKPRWKPSEAILAYGKQLADTFGR